MWNGGDQYMGTGADPGDERAASDSGDSDSDSSSSTSLSDDRVSAAPSSASEGELESDGPPPPRTMPVYRAPSNRVRVQSSRLADGSVFSQAPAPEELEEEAEKLQFLEEDLQWRLQGVALAEAQFAKETAQVAIDATDARHGEDEESDDEDFSRTHKRAQSKKNAHAAAKSLKEQLQDVQKKAAAEARLRGLRGAAVDAYAAAAVSTALKQAKLFSAKLRAEKSTNKRNVLLAAAKAPAPPPDFTASLAAVFAPLRVDRVL